jgi:general secretion pathway protein M
MSLATQFQRLSAREQKLLAVLGIALGLLVVLGTPVAIYRSVSERRATNVAMRDLLDKMGRSQDVLGERKRVRVQQALRYQRPAPQLASFIEKAAQENGIEVPESKDRPDAPKGKRYTERVTVVTLRKIGMAALVRTLEKIEQSGYPVAITRLSIKKRSGGPDMWDVELGVSAFDRKEEKKDGSAPGASGAPGGSASAGPAATKGGQL